MLFISNKKATVPAYRAYLTTLIRGAQLVAFLLSARIGAPWPSALSWLTTASSIFNLSILQQFYQASFYLSLYYASVVLVLVLTALLVYGLVSFAQGSFAALWPLRLLRELGNLAAGPLFIPVLQFLMSPFACDSMGFSRQGFACAGSGYVTQEIVSIVLSFLLVGLALIFTAVFFESHPLSPSPDAKAHGRVDILLLGVQVRLAPAFNASSCVSPPIH